MKTIGTLEENKMGIVPIGRLLADMAIPMMISMLVQALYNIVDSIYVSRISEDALTAVTLAFPLQLLSIAVGGGTAVGMNALLSRSLGEKDQKRVDRSANTGIFLFFCSSLFFAMVGIFFSELFFKAQTDADYIVANGVAYVRICLGCSVGIFMQFCFERLLQSTGKTRLAMLTQLIGAITNIVLDPILIFGLWGVPAMGVAGAAVATVSGQILAALFAIVLNMKYNPEVHIKIDLIRFDKEIVGEIYRVGLPSIIMQSIGSVMTFGMNKILIGFSTTATAVFGAYFKLQSFIFMPVFGLNNAMVPIIAYNYGAAKAERVKKTVTCTICAAVSIMVLGLLAFELFPAFFLSFFEASESMLAIGVPALRIIGTHFLLAGFCIISLSVCQAIGNPIYALITSVCRQLVVLLPSAWLLAQSGQLNLVWLAFPISELVSLIISAIFLKKTMHMANISMAGRVQN